MRRSIFCGTRSTTSKRSVRGRRPFAVTDLQAGLAKDQGPLLPPALEAPWTVQFKNLGKLLLDPRFTMDAVSSLVENRQALVRVEFRYDCEGDKEARFKSGYVVLAPDSDWAVQRYRITNPDGWQCEQTLEYGEPVNGFRPIKRILKISFGMDGRSTLVRETTQFSRFERREIPEDFFTFSAVGLPELRPRAAWASAMYWFWLVNAGVLLIIAGVLVRSKLRRSAVNNGSPVGDTTAGNVATGPNDLLG